MKFSLKKAMASVMISSSMMIPMAAPIVADSPNTTPITQVKIETPEDFVKYCLSFQTTTGSTTEYQAFKSVDDTNYQAIINSESTYRMLAQDATKKSAIDTLVDTNTEGVYPTYESMLTAAKNKAAEVQAQKQQEEAAKQQTQQAQQTTTQSSVNQNAAQSTTNTNTQSNQSSAVPNTNTNTSTGANTNENASTQTNSQSKNENTEVKTDTTTNESKTDSSTSQTEKENVSETPKAETTTPATQQDEKASVIPNEQPVLNTETVVFTGSANGVRVTVYAQPGAFEENTQMRVVPLDSQSALEDAKAILGDRVDQAVSVDISFWKDGQEVEPQKAVQVKLATDQFDAKSNISVIHDGGDNGVKSVGTSTDTKEVTISTSAFSPYTIASEKVIEPATIQAQTSVVTPAQEVAAKQEVSFEQKVNTEVAALQTTGTSALTSSIDMQTSAATTAQTFINTYLTSSTGVVYERANYTNYQNILNSKSAWDNLSASEKIQVNSILTKKISKTYIKLYSEAKAMDVPTQVNTSVATQYVSYTVMCGVSILGVISIRKKQKSE